MKPFIALLLCITLLLCLGCQKDDSKQENFYNADDYIQNEAIVAVMNTTDLTAPVEEISYTLCDNSDLGVSVTHYTMLNDRRIHRLEIYENGEWKEAPTAGVAMHQRLEAPGTDSDPSAHRKHERKMDFRYIDGGLVHYLPLERGEYRLIVTYAVNTDDPDVTIPEGEHAALLYFTVT